MGLKKKRNKKNVGDKETEEELTTLKMFIRDCFLQLANYNQVSKSMDDTIMSLILDILGYLSSLLCPLFVRNQHRGSWQSFANLLQRYLTKRKFKNA